MSNTLLALAKSFRNERLTADEFANAYMGLWKYERDNALLAKDGEMIGECLDNIFCIADLYNPQHDRDEFELDEVELRDKIDQLIDKLQVF